MNNKEGWNLNIGDSFCWNRITGPVEWWKVYEVINIRDNGVVLDFKCVASPNASDVGISGYTELPQALIKVGKR
jgi:hypothetical protein